MSIKQKQIKQLLKLQELFHFDYLTGQLLNEMILLYVRLVQKISQLSYPLKIYFMQKIKFVLSTPQIIKILQKKATNNSRSMRQTIQGSIGLNEQQNQIIMRQLAWQAKQQNEIDIKNSGKKDRHYQDRALAQQLKLKQCNLKIQLQMEFMQQIQQNIKKITQQFHTVDQKRGKKVQEIIQIVNQQDQNLSQRLAKRRKKIKKQSASIHQQQLIQHQQQNHIQKQQLFQFQKQINQTYQRFTQLTQTLNLPPNIKTAKLNNDKLKNDFQYPCIQQKGLTEIILPQYQQVFKKNNQINLSCNSVQSLFPNQATEPIIMRFEQCEQNQQQEPIF